MRIDSYKKLVEIFSNKSLKLVAIDADDTLWHDSKYYRYIEDFLIRMSRALGIEQSYFFGLLSKTCRKYPPGERGWADGVWEAANMLNLKSEHLTELKQRLDLFLNHPIELLPYSLEVLGKMENYQKVFLTKGNEEEQKRKLDKSKLSDFFSAIRILERKNAEQFAHLLKSLNIKGTEALVIGNSVRHDIIPAVKNEAAAIWLNHSENAHGRNAELPSTACEVKGWYLILKAIKKRILIDSY